MGWPKLSSRAGWKETRMTLENSAMTLSHMLRDYRRHEGVRVNTDSVLRWVHQFDAEVRNELLVGLTNVLTGSYFNAARCRELVRQFLLSPGLTGGNPRLYWSTTSLAEIQQRGSSQRILFQMLRQAAAEEFGSTFRFGGVESPRHFYIDDFIFSGQRLKEDFSRWIAGGRLSQQPRQLDIGLFGVHSLGLYYFKRHAASEILAVDRRATYRMEFASTFENRRAYRESSGVYWPSINAASLGYAQFDDARLTLRNIPQPPPAHEPTRQLLERELLKAGCRIASSCASRLNSLRPMGYYNFGHGFGAACATYLNCPNNAPLAIWWATPTTGLPQGWHALLPRRIND